MGRKLRLSHPLCLGDQLDSSSWWPLSRNLLHDTMRFTVMPSRDSITKSTSTASGLDGWFRERRGLQQSNMQTMKDRSPEGAKMSRACFLERKREVEERGPMTTFNENLLVLNKLEALTLQSGEMYVSCSLSKVRKALRPLGITSANLSPLMSQKVGLGSLSAQR